MKGANDRSSAILVGLLCVTALAGAVAWGAGIFHRSYDYDEVEWTHAIWMTAAGLRPYQDFFQNHPLFFMYLLAPLARLAGESPHILTFFRFFTALGALLFISGIFANVALSFPSRKVWGGLGIVLVACAWPALNFLVEFRVDNWAYALFFWSIWAFRKNTDQKLRYEQFGFLVTLSVLASPKLAPLAPLIAAFEMLPSRRDPRKILSICGRYLAGIASAFALVLLFLLIVGIDIRLAYDCGFGYHVYYNQVTSFRHGLWNSITGHTVLLPFVLSGVLAWLAIHLWERKLPDYFELAAALFLAVQLVVVSFPHKQYYVPWFFVAAYFWVYMGSLLARLRPPYHLALVALMCLLSLLGSWRAFQEWKHGRGADRDRALIALMNDIALPGDRVVAIPPSHPIFRRDALYGWVNTYDPEGPRTEFLASKFPSLKERFSEQAYREELERHAPVFVSLGGSPQLTGYDPLQTKVLREFLRERRYRVARLGGVYIAVRRDCQARLNGNGVRFEPLSAPDLHEVRH